MFLLFIEHRTTGYVQVLTFPTLFARALRMISLSREPVVLRTVDYG